MSILDKVTPIVTQLARKSSDFNLQLIGTSAQVLRITLGEADIFGQQEEALEPTMNIIADVIIKHPLGSQVQLYEYLSESREQSTGGIDLWEILPFEMKILFQGDYATEPISIKKGDLIVEVLRDAYNNKIPVIFEVTKSWGGFFGKNMNSRKYDLALYRGNLPSALQNAVNTYIEGL